MALSTVPTFAVISCILVIAFVLSHFARRAIGRYWLQLDYDTDLDRAIKEIGKIDKP